MIKMVTHTTSRVSDAEVINDDADDSKGRVAHDTQMRYSPFFFRTTLKSVSKWT